MRFTDAYCNSPICVPSRASFATGRYVHEIRFWDNAIPYNGSRPSWGHRLIEAGHSCVSIGKLHYRSTEDNNGFDPELMPLHVVDGRGDVLGLIRDPLPERNAALRVGRTAGPGNSSYQDYDDQITGAAQAWLRNRAREKGGKPWVLFVSLVCPHFQPWDINASSSRRSHSILPNKLPAQIRVVAADKTSTLHQRSEYTVLNAIGSTELEDGKYLYSPATGKIEVHWIQGIGSAAAPGAASQADGDRDQRNPSRKLPWGLVLLGVSLVIAVELLGVRSLTFAVGASAHRDHAAYILRRSGAMACGSGRTERRL